MNNKAVSSSSNYDNDIAEFFLFYVLLVYYFTTVLISVVVSCLPAVAAERLFLVQLTKPERQSLQLLFSLEPFKP